MWESESEVGSGAQGCGLARDRVMVSEWRIFAGAGKAEEYKGEVSNRFVVKIKELSRSLGRIGGSLENTHKAQKKVCCGLWHRDSKRHGTAVQIRTDFGGGQTRPSKRNWRL